MKAVYFNETGGPEVLEYGVLPDPVCGAGEVVVDVHAASVNGVDWRIRAGQYKEISSFPYVLGRDFSGVISAVAADVTDLAIGDEVLGVCETTDDGAYAERVAIKASQIIKKPASLGHEMAAALALAGLTAMVSMMETLRLQRGERILILGGAGGVGGLAVQIARFVGAEVAATASLGNHNYVRHLGAKHLVDYRTEDFRTRIKDYDAVLDTVGGPEATRAFDSLRPGGRAAFIASGAEAPHPTRPDVTSLRPQVRRERRFLQSLLDVYEAGALRLPEIFCFALQDAAKAHALSESRHLRGKLVLQIAR